jgi:hypothetical protein
MSTYENTLTSWASTGQRLKSIDNKHIDTKIRDDLQLIGGQIYFRHGARTPLNLLPGLEEVYSKISLFERKKWFFFRCLIEKNMLKVSHLRNGILN